MSPRSALVIGGGLAGSSAALRLARAGIAVDLFERERGPHHKVCGEFFSIEAQHDLKSLGIDPLALGAVPIDRVRLIAGTREVETRLPFVALGLTRERLDEVLLDAARKAGATIHRGVRVLGMTDCDVQTSEGDAHADMILLATGKHDLRGSPRPKPAPGHEHVGVKMHWRLTPAQDRALGGLIEVVHFDGGYAGLQRVAPGLANLCVLLRQDRFRAAGGTWPGLLATLMAEPHLARRLEHAEPAIDRPPTVAGLPYGWVAPAYGDDPETLYRLGDQSAVTAPLTGDGMAIALRSAALAAAVIEAGHGAGAYRGALRAMVRPQVRRAMVLHHFAGKRPVMGALLALLGLSPALVGTLARLTRLPEGAPV